MNQKRNKLLTIPLNVIANKTLYESEKKQITHYPAQSPRFVDKKTIAKFEQLFQKPLTLTTAFKLLSAYGFRLPKSAIINSSNEVGEAYRFVTKPAVVKTAAMDIKHKAKYGGVILNIMSAVSARLAFQKLQKLGPEVVFQQTVVGELELIIGAKRDKQLGPFLTIGMGGSLTNALEDRTYAFLPATKTYFTAILKQTKAFKVIKDRQLPIDPIIEAMQRLSAILLDYPVIDELEINPAILTKKSLYAADIKITLMAS